MSWVRPILYNCSALNTQRQQCILRKCICKYNMTRFEALTWRRVPSLYSSASATSSVSRSRVIEMPCLLCLVYTNAKYTSISARKEAEAPVTSGFSLVMACASTIAAYIVKGELYNDSEDISSRKKTFGISTTPPRAVAPHHLAHQHTTSNSHRNNTESV